MLATAFYALATFFALQCAVVPQQEYVIERGRVGLVSIGVEADSIHRHFRDRARLVDLQLEGQLTPALEIKLFGSQLVASMIAEISPAGGRLVIGRIHVIDPSLRTRDGIGVGSTVGELRSRYSIDSVGSGEGSVYVRVESLGASFQLDVSRFPMLLSIRDAAQLPDSVRIVSVMLT